MNEYKIITGNARECENQLNIISKTNYIIVEGFVTDKEGTTICISMIKIVK